MGARQKCALAACKCQVRGDDRYCSEYCQQAAIHGTEKDYCQCPHESEAGLSVQPEPELGMAAAAGGASPQTQDRLPVDSQHMLERAVLRSTRLEDAVGVQVRVGRTVQKQPVSSLRLRVKAQGA